jgi:hypothetical protein
MTMLTHCPLERILPGLLVLGLLCPPPAVAEQRLRITDYPADRRMVFTLDAGSGTELVASGRLPSGGMLHRFRIELLGAAAADVELRWNVALEGWFADLPTTVVRLRPALQTVELPKPLGVRVAAGDSIRVYLHIGTAVDQPVRFLVTIDYEPLDGPLSRLGVVPVQLHAARHDDAGALEATARVWEWTAPIGGRLLALAGLPATAAGDLVLEDIDSGRIVWRGVLPAASREPFAGGAEVIRVGVTIDAGRSYRLISSSPRDATPFAGPVDGLVLPAAGAGIRTAAR